MIRHSRAACPLSFNRTHSRAFVQWYRCPNHQRSMSCSFKPACPIYRAGPERDGTDEQYATGIAVIEKIYCSSRLHCAALTTEADDQPCDSFCSLWTGVRYSESMNPPALQTMQRPNCNCFTCLPFSSQLHRWSVLIRPSRSLLTNMHLSHFTRFTWMALLASDVTPSRRQTIPAIR